MNLNRLIVSSALLITASAWLSSCKTDSADDVDGPGGESSTGGKAGSGGRSSSGGAAGETGVGGAGGDADENFDEPLYAMMVQVFDVNWDRTVYVHLTKEIDASGIDLTRAREFPGVANFVPFKDNLLTSSGTAATITFSRVSDDFEWFDGDSISFANFPVGDNANLFAHHFLDEHTAYFPFEYTSRLVWDPTEMTIKTTHEDSSIPLTKDGLEIDNAGNRNSVHFDGEVQQAFFYHDEDWFLLGPESIIAFYDRETHEESRTITAPCPGLAIATRDEAGYTYYGTWTSPVVLALFDAGPKPCNVRITPDGELDEAWTTDFTEWTGGRSVNNFRYVGGGRAIGNVLHHDLVDFDWDNGYDAAIDDILAEGDYWRLWLFDLESETAKEIEGIDVALGDAAQFAVLDGRTFVFVPYQEWSRTRIYEIDEDGVATERGDTLGDVFKWEKIR